ncbi:acylneuraminate cytidylyltransferase family protein (plasmid) [Rhizobium sp. WL3]|uniref:acylneuraminate cytidylyltransferase family protein n=1 Tax=Rhizobium sp. WL3 TaxID=2603277 RepID=UPI0011C1EB9A|nr:acylneuraminate cytidylyltransferase family protein [Rhizobium sp. WL3]QEE43662.1 acylneuraminate cytidylyltransferase family protein [Rhizobium sp. WL3]
MTSRICTICARGGSKGVVNKNIRLLDGKPLIAHSIERARASGLFASIAVSSDSEAILEIAGVWGANYLIRRPDELATDKAAKIPAIRHCLHEAERLSGLKPSTFVDLDATSPLRSVDDIRGAVALLEERGVSSVITGTAARRSPYFNLVEEGEDGFVRISKTLDRPVVRRQDAPRCFDMNASIYVWKRDRFLAEPSVFYKDTLIFEMPEDRSPDIDSELDFEWVRYLMERGKRNG